MDRVNHIIGQAYRNFELPCLDDYKIVKTIDNCNKFRLIIKLFFENGKEAYMKVYRDAHTTSNILNQQVNLICAYRKNSIPVPMRYKTFCNDTFFLYNGNSSPAYVLLEDAVSGEMIKPSIEIIPHIAELLANMHRIAERERIKTGLLAPYGIMGSRRYNFGTDIIKLNTDYFFEFLEEHTNCHKAAFYLKRLFNDNYYEICRLWDKLPKGALHGDYFPWNILSKKNEVTGIIDFNYCCDNAFALDLASSAAYFAFETGLENQNEAFHLFIKHYSQVRRLSLSESMAVEAMCRCSIICLRSRLDRILLTAKRYPKQTEAMLEQLLLTLDKTRNILLK